MKIALAQINTTVGDFDGIVRKVVAFIKKAKSEGVSLIAFPEMTTTGYPPRDLLEIPSFIDGNLRALEAIARATHEITAVVGFVDRNPGGRGKPLFNAAALIQEGSVKARYYKALLPTYDVFDEGRYFEPGTETGLWNVERVSEHKPDPPPIKIGISICEDYWSEEEFGTRRLYVRDPIGEQVRGGAQILLNLSSSPFSVGKENLRLSLYRDMSGDITSHSFL
jgi:predicted amidohydrolase